MPVGRPRAKSAKYPSLKALGANIEAIRKYMKMNQTEFGQLLGVSQNSVSRWERALAQPTSMQILNICYKCGVSADDLLSVPRKWVKIK